MKWLMKKEQGSQAEQFELLDKMGPCNQKLFEYSQSKNLELVAEVRQIPVESQAQIFNKEGDYLNKLLRNVAYFLLVIASH